MTEEEEAEHYRQSAKSLADCIRSCRSSVRNPNITAWHRANIIAEDINRFTNPAKLRTDREHAACCRITRWLRKEAHSRGYMGRIIKESENTSRLYAVR